MGTEAKRMNSSDLTVNRTPNPDCPACKAFSRHTPEEYRQFHPLGGHGFARESGWTHPDIAPDAARQGGNRPAFDFAKCGDTSLPLKAFYRL